MAFVFCFPGQGSQKINMVKDFYDKFDLARDRFDLAARISGRNFSDIIFNGTEDQLKSTENTQPSLFLVESIITDILREHNITCDCALGHSLGEYSALYAAGFFSFEDGFRMVFERGRLMSLAGEVEKGSMAAILGMPRNTIKEIIAAVTDGTVVSANENAPDQTIISGHAHAVDKAIELLTKSGAKRAMKLPVSGAFHSPLMAKAAEQFEKFISSISFTTPRCPIISNVTAEIVNEPGAAKSLLIKQLLNPVRFVDMIEYLAKNYPSHNAIEVGPGNVLKGLIKKCDNNRNVVSCETVDNLFSLV